MEIMKLSTLMMTRSRNMEEKRNLYFQRSNGEYRLLGENVTEDEARVLRNTFLYEHNFKSYYVRMW